MPLSESRFILIFFEEPGTPKYNPFPALNALAMRHERWESLELIGSLSFESVFTLFGVQYPNAKFDLTTLEDRPMPRIAGDQSAVYDFPRLRSISMVSRGATARSVIGFPHIRAENVTKLSLLGVIIRLDAYVNLVRGTPNVKWISLRDVRWFSNTAVTETLEYLARNSIGHSKLQSLTFQCTGIPEVQPPAVQPYLEPLAFFHKLVENTSHLCSVTAIRPFRRFQASLWTVISSTNAYAALRPHVSAVTSLDLNILELTNNPG
jgi:hypothetical protein